MASLSYVLAALALAGCSLQIDAAPQPDAGVTRPDADAPDAADAPADAGPSPQVIAVSLGKAANGETYVTAQVSVGGSAPFTALVDTGSTGLRVLTGTISDADWNVTSVSGNYSFTSGVAVHGHVADGVVTIDGASTRAAIPMMDIESVSCTRPGCPATGKDATTFRFAGSYPAILGIGMEPAPTGVASPLVALAQDGRAVIALPAFGGASGAITVDPSSSDLARFTTLVTLSQANPNIQGSWSEKVPFCINQFCAVGLLDTGTFGASLAASTAADDTALGVPSGSAVIPGGTVIDETIGQTAAWSYTVSTPPKPGLDRFGLGATTNNLGLAPFHQFDVLYDYERGIVGLAPKP